MVASVLWYASWASLLAKFMSIAVLTYIALLKLRMLSETQPRLALLGEHLFSSFCVCLTNYLAMGFVIAPEAVSGWVVIMILWAAGLAFVFGAAFYGVVVCALWRTASASLAEALTEIDETTEHAGVQRAAAWMQLTAVATALCAGSTVLLGVVQEAERAIPYNLFIRLFEVNLNSLDSILNSLAAALLAGLLASTDAERRVDESLQLVATHALEQTALRREEKLLAELQQSIEISDDFKVASLMGSLQKLGWSRDSCMRKVQGLRADYSKECGVCLAWILSTEFKELAQQLAGKDDPTFYELKEAFYMNAKLGWERTCPRDGKQGCAFVDTLPPHHRGRCTHFLSWTWAYSVGTLQDALGKWVTTSGKDPQSTFLFCCFFVNNQYRILYTPDSKDGEENLEDIFARNLLRIGKVVALLDTYDNPKYLTRIWTIYRLGR